VCVCVRCCDSLTLQERQRLWLEHRDAKVAQKRALAADPAVVGPFKPALTPTSARSCVLLCSRLP
jgi:hypothetical protein